MTQGSREARNGKGGFTLIEISIVLIVIGLIVGGVLVGRDLINAASMRKALSDIDQINAAALTFRLKYNGLPGDLPNATSFFSDCSPSDTIAGWIPNNCNGNGDGVVGASGVNSARINASSESSSRFLEHLSRAKLIEGNYVGAAGSGLIAGVNTYGADWLNTFKSPGVFEDVTGISAQVIHRYPCLLDAVQGCESWQPHVNLRIGREISVRYLFPRSGPKGASQKRYRTLISRSLLNTSTKHRIIFSSIRPAPKEFELSLFDGVKATFARDIDTKIDDGKPLAGKVRVFWREGYGWSCTNGTGDATQNYQLVTYPTCRLMIELGF